MKGAGDHLWVSRPQTSGQRNLGMRQRNQKSSKGDVWEFPQSNSHTTREVQNIDIRKAKTSTCSNHSTNWTTQPVPRSQAKCFPVSGAAAGSQLLPRARLFSILSFEGDHIHTYLFRNTETHTINSSLAQRASLECRALGKPSTWFPSEGPV